MQLAAISVGFGVAVLAVSTPSRTIELVAAVAENDDDEVVEVARFSTTAWCNGIFLAKETEAVPKSKAPVRERSIIVGGWTKWRIRNLERQKEES